jgi:head-to-tail connecting protein
VATPISKLENPSPNQERKQTQAQEELAARVIRDYSRMWENRGVFENHWNEIARRIDPMNRDSFNPLNQRTAGAKRNEEVFDSTGVLALNRFAAILDSMLTPRNSTWHKLQCAHPDLKKDKQTSLWFDQVNALLFKYRYSPHANFSAQNQRNYKSLGAYGTGCVFVDRLSGGPGIRYKSIHLGNVYFSENHQGIVDKAIRRFKITAKQAVEKFGMDNIPGAIIAQLAVAPETEFDFIHCVERREDFDPGRKDYKGMRFAAYYVSMIGNYLCDESGYNIFPYAISRYEQAEDEVYGRSPAMDALPEIKTLQEKRKTALKVEHRMADPVLLAHDDGIVDGFSLRPGALNSGAVTADGRPLVHALPVGSPQVASEMVKESRELIEDHFMTSLFQILTESPQMTATEVMERTREKGILLAPVLGRQQSEYLGPMVDREISLLMQQGLLPPMPPQLRAARGEYSVMYDSPLSRAQRAEEGAGVQRVMEQAMAYFNATQDPSVFDYLNIDEIIPAIADISGVPQKWMRTKSDVDQMRAQRAQQQQQEQMMKAAPGAAAVTNAAAKMKQASNPGAGQ